MAAGGVAGVTTGLTNNRRTPSGMVYWVWLSCLFLSATWMNAQTSDRNVTFWGAAKIGGAVAPGQSRALQQKAALGFTKPLSRNVFLQCFLWGSSSEASAATASAGINLRLGYRHTLRKSLSVQLSEGPQIDFSRTPLGWNHELSVALQPPRTPRLRFIATHEITLSRPDGVEHQVRGAFAVQMSKHVMVAPTYEWDSSRNDKESRVYVLVVLVSH